MGCHLAIGGQMPKSILIVDDSAAIRKFIRIFLENQPGFEVCGEGADGVEAVEKARELKPDLIVLDLSMPRMNGLGAAEILRQVLPMVPIILFTAYKDAVLNEHALAAGVSSVVSKADGVEILLSEVQKLTSVARLANVGL